MSNCTYLQNLKPPGIEWLGKRSFRDWICEVETYHFKNNTNKYRTVSDSGKDINKPYRYTKRIDFFLNR